MDNESIQGDERGTYVALERIRPTECGKAYGTRVLGSRSARSSRGSNDPPGPTGEPLTGRRGTPHRCVDRVAKPEYSSDDPCGHHAHHAQTVFLQ